MSEKLDRLIESADDLIEMLDSSKEVPDFLREFLKIMIAAGVANELGAAYPREKDVREAFNKIQWPNETDGLIGRESHKFRKRLAALFANG